MVSQLQKRPFIYGKFVWPGKPQPKAKEHQVPAFLVRILDRDRVGIEILREFSATELVGKIYLMGGAAGNWVPVDITAVKDQDWYRAYTEAPKALRRGFYFDVEGSGRWAILYLRAESDDAGPYVAIALRYE